MITLKEIVIVVASATATIAVWYVALIGTIILTAQQCRAFGFYIFFFFHMLSYISSHSFFSLSRHHCVHAVRYYQCLVTSCRIVVASIVSRLCRTEGFSCLTACSSFHKKHGASLLQAGSCCFPFLLFWYVEFKNQHIHKFIKKGFQNGKSNNYAKCTKQKIKSS